MALTHSLIITPATQEVFIVTAWRWGQVLGYINVSFETTHNGRILAYKGGPIPMNSTTEQDEDLQKKIDDWRVPFDAFSKEVVGVTRDVLDGSSCQLGECGFCGVVFGGFVADVLFLFDAVRHFGECYHRCDIGL